MDGLPSTLKDSGQYKDEKLLIGALGEIAVIDYCWNNDLLAYKMRDANSSAISAVTQVTHRSQSSEGLKCSRDALSRNFASIAFRKD
jgi:hypothetical protein